jgi:hypothetical protein
MSKSKIEARLAVLENDVATIKKIAWTGIVMLFAKAGIDIAPLVSALFG